MFENIPVRGYVELYKNGKMIYEHHNTIGTAFYSQCRNLMTTRVGLGVDALAWGSFNTSSNTFVDGTYAGTTSSGTIGNLIQSLLGTNQCKFSGTFTFGETKLLNYFGLGNGWIAPTGAVNLLFNYNFAYDNAMVGTNNVQYDNGDIAILNWTIQIAN
jgi:hypothetical protein